MVNLYVLRSDQPKFGVRSKKFTESEFEKKFGRLNQVLKNTLRGNMFGLTTKSQSIAIKRNAFKFKLAKPKVNSKGIVREINVIDLN